MTGLVLRVAAPLQSWSGYRHLAKMDSTVPTEALPRKSAISGLIGAALGPLDNGFGSARDLTEVGERYDLHVRVETRNATSEDFQTLGPLRPSDHASAQRALSLAEGSARKFPSIRGGGNFPTEVSRRDFLAHSEFILALEGDDDTLEAWLAALREPVFMPYFGRRSCAPTFPFVLGLYERGAASLFGELPHVDKYHQDDPLVAYEVLGDYNQHLTAEHPAAYTPPSSSRSEQLDWTKENLR